MPTDRTRARNRRACSAHHRVSLSDKTPRLIARNIPLSGEIALDDEAIDFTSQLGGTIRKLWKRVPQR